jgi:predicted dehydrogenase
MGKVLTARARYGWSGSWWSDWFYRVGGGALFDLAVYNLTTLTGLLGPAKRVMAMTGVALREREIGGERIRVEAIDNAQVLIDFGECVFAAVTTGFTMQKYRGPALEFYGTEGTIQMLGDDWAPQGYELWQSGEESWRIFPETAPHWRWTDGLRHLVECVQRHEEPAVRPEHAYHVLELMLKAQESGRTGHSQLIESTFAPRTER